MARSIGSAGVEFIQSETPTNPSDGDRWIDTSDPARPMRIYSKDRGAFVPTYESVPLFVTEEVITFGESSITISAPTEIEADTGSGVLRLADNEVTPWGPPGSTNTYTDGICFEFEPTIDFTGLSGDISSEITGLNEVFVQDTNGNKIAGDTDVSPGGTFNITGATFSAGTRYEVHVHLSDFSNDTQTYYGSSAPHDLEIWTVYNYNEGSYVRNVGNVTPNSAPTSASATLSWDSIPGDLSAWDRVTWQEVLDNGDLTVDVEVNDGSGWTTLEADATPPYSIASVDPSTDVRLNFSFSRSAGTDPSPKVPYVARRGER